jgi:cell division protein FtsQ
VKEAAKPYRNQRVSRPRQRTQQHLLEVSVRASKARQQRIRWALGVIFKLILIAGVIAGIWIGGREGLQRYFWHNPALFLTEFNAESDGTLTKAQIMTTAGVRKGENIFLTDLAAARQALDKLPQVERVDIQRTLPNRIDITITERQPIAWVVSKSVIDPTASEEAFLADARGYVMKSRKLLPTYYHLPIISGVETENLVAGQKVTTMEVQAALQLLQLNADSTRWQVRNIDVTKGYCLQVTDRNHALVTFGLDKIDGQLTRLYRLLDYLQGQEPKQDIRTVNLFLERNIPVTFTEPAEPDPVTPEATGAETRGDSKAKPTAETAVAAKKAETKVAAAASPSGKKPETSSSTRSKEKTSAASTKKPSTTVVKKPFRM